MSQTRKAHEGPTPHPGEGKDHWISRLVLFVLTFAFWLLLVWPAPSKGGLPWGEVAVGVVVAALVTLVMRDIVTGEFGRLLQPARYFWAAVYLVVLGYYVSKANLDVAYRVLHPAMPIRPGIVRVTTRLRSASARTALANSITLTPGTLTMDISADGMLYVHWINVTSEDEQEVARQILGRFEWFIEKIFE